MRPQVPAHPDDDRLLELAYGEVPEAEVRALRKHVDGCARCRGLLEGFAQVRTAFRSVPPEPAPERGLESLLAYGEQAAARARSRRGGLRLLGLLSAAAALAVVWLVLPPRDTVGPVSRGPAGASDTLARADRPGAPAQGDRAMDDEKGAAAKVGQAPTPAAAPAATAAVSEKKERVAEQQAVPGRRAAGKPVEAEAKRKDVAKRDAPAAPLAVAEAEAEAQRRAEAAPGDRSAAHSNLSGALGAAGGADVSATKGAGSGTLDLQAMARQRPADDGRAQDAAKVAAAPLAKTAPVASGGKAGAPAPEAMRVAVGAPEQQARLEEIRRKLETASGNERKALLMERCEIEASLQRGPDAVVSCSQVTREFPGTPEATRASEIARGFSLQLPTESPQR